MANELMAVEYESLSGIRRADKFPDYRGFKAGICVAYTDKKGDFRLDSDGMPIIKKKEGAAVYKQLGEVLMGGWCEVRRERTPGHIETSYMEVTLDEYSTGKSNWTAKPATMVRKVAVSQAFRAAFPNEYEGLYTEDEMVASGAIPAEYTIEEDPAITQEQRQTMFKMAQSAFGKEEGNNLLMRLLKEESYESTHDLPVSVFRRIVNRIMELRSQKEADDAENGADHAVTEQGADGSDSLHE